MRSMLVSQVWRHYQPGCAGRLMLLWLWQAAEKRMKRSSLPYIWRTTPDCATPYLASEIHRMAFFSSIFSLTMPAENALCSYLIA
jgi:hypothetical protein